MSIDIEHFSKMHLLKFITDNYAGSNACDIVGEYVSSLDSFRQKELNKVIIRKLNSVYTDNVCEKYGYQLDSKTSYLPVQEFFEVIPFGKFTNFYQFCTEKFFNLSSEEKRHRQKSTICCFELKMPEMELLMIIASLII